MNCSRCSTRSPRCALAAGLLSTSAPTIAVGASDPVVERSREPPPLPPGLTKPTIHCTLGVEFSTASVARVISTVDPTNALLAARSSSSGLVVKACSGVSRESRLKIPTQVPGGNSFLTNCSMAAMAHLRALASRL